MKRPVTRHYYAKRVFLSLADYKLTGADLRLKLGKPISRRQAIKYWRHTCRQADKMAEEWDRNQR